MSILPPQTETRSQFFETLKNNMRQHYRTLLRNGGLDKVLDCRQKIIANPDGWLADVQLAVINEVLYQEGFTDALLAEQHVGTGEEELHEPHHPHMRKKK